MHIRYIIFPPITIATGQEYVYKADLQALDACINPSPPKHPLALCIISTPLLIRDTWVAHLASHPDRAPVNYIIDGISNGFRIGFSHPRQYTLCSSNHPSANEHPLVISIALQNEVTKGRLKGPFNPREYLYIQVSSLSAVPKKQSTDKWRLILDLSHPKGSSVNDGIDHNFCSLSYIKVEDVVRQIIQLGKGRLLAKIDIESAFRNIPVHPHDRHLLGMQ